MTRPVPGSDRVLGRQRIPPLNIPPPPPPPPPAEPPSSDGALRLIELPGQRPRWPWIAQSSSAVPRPPRMRIRSSVC